MTTSTRKIWTAWAFLALPLALFLAVRFGPTLYLLGSSLTNAGLLQKHPKFIGLGNFATLFSDPIFLKSLGNTLTYALVGSPLAVGLGLYFALKLNRIGKGSAWFRLVALLPYVTPVVAVGWVWRWIFTTPPFGVLDAILMFFGLPAQPFLNSPQQALWCVLTVNVWVELGYCMVIFLAGIKTVSPSLLEAARMDGATESQTTRRIVIPLMAPVTLFLIVTEVIQFLRIFTQVYTMSFQSQGGPLDSTKSVALYLYQKAFTEFDTGLATAAGLVLFVFILVVTLLQLVVFDKRSER